MTLPPIDQLSTRIGTARSQTVLWAMMVQLSRELGFGAVGYMLFDKARTGRPIAMLQLGFRPQVVQKYVELGYDLHDPTLRAVFTTGRPWRYSEVEARFQLSRREQNHRTTFNSMEGATDGMGFPLFGPNGHDAYAVLGRPLHAGALEQANRTGLHMVAQAAHLRALQLQAAPRLERSELSEREIEILGWVAQGKSNVAISRILEIAPATVDTYLRRIFEKLHVTDRTSAAVKGVSMGLVRA